MELSLLKIHQHRLRVAKITNHYLCGFYARKEIERFGLNKSFPCRYYLPVVVSLLIHSFCSGGMTMYLRKYFI